jgi:hypothetical protein
LQFRFQGGWAEPTSRSRSDDDTVGELAAFNVPAAVEALRRAPETVGIKPDEVSETVLDIDELATEPGAASDLELLIKVSGSPGYGYIYLDAAGNTKRVEYPG